MRKILLLLSLSLLLVFDVNAAKIDSLKLSRWKVGVSTGYHINVMRLPGIRKTAYTSRDAGHSGLFVLSAEYSAPKNFSIRPEIAFLSRGGGFYIANVGQISQGLYSLKASYFDIRVPVIYNIGLKKTKLVPYAYVAPIVGFAMRGRVKLQERLINNTENVYDLKLTNANIASSYFAMALGAGVKYPINIAGYSCNLGVELSYELGLTDTYSRKERTNNVDIVNNVKGPVASARKFSGFELKASFSVPLTIFKKRKKPVKTEPVFVPKPVEKPIEKPCYTLKEIQDMVKEGKDVNGKTICSVDDINFDTAKSTIKESSKPYLNQVIEVLIETGLYVEVQGHTDSTGSAELNEKLSKDRALTVVKYLADNGVPWEKISYKYFGETKPLTTNDTPEGRKLNRRVAFVLKKK